MAYLSLFYHIVIAEEYRQIMGKMDTRTSPEAEKYVNSLLDEGETNILMNFEAPSSILSDY